MGGRGRWTWWESLRRTCLRASGRGQRCPEVTVFFLNGAREGRCSKTLVVISQRTQVHVCRHWRKSWAKFGPWTESEHGSDERLEWVTPRGQAPDLLQFSGNVGEQVHGIHSKRQPLSFFLKMDFLTGNVNTFFSAPHFSS